MPKVVDPDVRRQEVAEAVWRVIRRGGFSSASMRNVAAEADLSLGSLRHYFASHDELIIFSMHLVIERASARLLALSKRRPAKLTDPAASVRMVLSELLPLNDERHEESQIWLAFMGTSISDPRLRPTSNEMHDRIFDLEVDMLNELVRAGLAPPDLDLQLEATRLHALLDGLAVGAVTRPERITRDVIKAVLDRHLLSLKPQ
jgi:AcrR family transcriptional regulator